MSLMVTVFKVLGPPVGRAAFESWRRLVSRGNPLRYAADRTQSEFEGVEGLAERIGLWASTDQVTALLAAIESGQRDWNVTDLIDAFTGVGFYHGDETAAKAEEILTRFLEIFVRAIYEGADSGLPQAMRTEVLHDEVVQHASEQTEILKAHVTEELQSFSRTILSRAAETNAGDGALDPLDERHDVIRDLIRDGSPEMAKRRLLAMRTELASANPSARALFRLATNLGASYLALGETVDACREFDLAYQMFPNDPRALTNAAVAALIRRDVFRAVELARQAHDSSPEDRDAVTALIETLTAAEDFAAIERLAQEHAWIKDELPSAAALARALLREGKCSEAETLLRPLVTAETTEPWAHIILGQSIALRLQNDLNGDPPLRSQLSTEQLSQITAARGAGDHAVATARIRHDRDALVTALILRSGTMSLTEEWESALEDCDEALRLHPDLQSALVNRGVLLLHLDRPVEAVRVLERAARQQKTSEGAVLLGRAHLRAGHPERAIPVLEAYWDQSVTVAERFPIADMLIRAYARSGRRKEAEGVLAKLSDFNIPAESVAELEMEFCVEVEEFSRALEVLRDAMASATPRGKARLLLMSADIHHRLGDHESAAAAYECTVDVSRDTAPTRRYVASLYNCHRYDEALEIATRIRANASPVPVISEVEALVLEHTGNLADASVLIGVLAEYEPEMRRHKVHLAELQHRLGKIEEARATLQSINLSDLGADTGLLIRVSSLRYLLGEPDTLEPVYRARRIGTNDPETHVAYWQHCLWLGDEHPAMGAANEVVVGTSVRLKHGADERTYVIEAADLNPLQGYELRPTDELTRQLLGKRVGDSVILGSSEFGESRYEVVEILSKFVHALRETMSDFPVRWPEHPAMQRIELKDRDLTPILVAVERRHTFISRAEALYRSRQLTIGAFAVIVGASPIEVWGTLTGQPGARLLSANGSSYERSRADAALAESPRAVLDLTCVLTLVHLCSEDIPEGVVTELIVPQSILDEVLEFEVASGTTRLRRTIGKADDRYVLEERTDIELSALREFLARVRTFISERCRIVSVPSLATSESMRLADTLGHGAVAALLAAAENGAVLYSDDLVLRNVAAARGVGGVWTQSVWQAAVRRDHSLLARYRTAVARLAEANYWFLGIDHEDVLSALRAADWTISNPVRRLLETLAGPDCQELPAISVAARVLKHAWPHVPLVHQQASLLDLILESVTKGRPAQRAAALLKAAVAREFALLPFEAAEIALRIDLRVRARPDERRLIR